MNHTQMAVKGTRRLLKNPSYLIEWGYFVVLVYANLGPAYGLAIPLAGAGLLGGLTVLCLMHFGSLSWVAFQPIRYALGCAISILLIQGLWYEESLNAGIMRSLITWIFSLIIIQSLALRKGFLHRFALVAFLIGCATLPFMKAYVASDQMVRIGGGGGVALANPNYFGLWFGFCTVYFIVAGVEAKNDLIRAASWLAGILCLYLMALSVSRGALLGVAIATVIAFEKVLKRSFLPIFGGLCLVWVVYVAGVFDGLIGYYLHRGAEETGRSRLWSWAFTEILESWGFGVGLADTLSGGGTSSTGHSYGPHNSFLFVWLSSGYISIACYIAYLVQVTRGAFLARTQKNHDSPYILPLVSFALLAVMVADETFMSPWHIMVFSAAITTVQVNQTPTGNFVKGESDKIFP